MRLFIPLLLAGTLTACGPKVADYQNMTVEQKAAYLKKYEADMMKAFSLSNKRNKMKALVTSDPSQDLISISFSMDIDIPAGMDAMGNQMEGMLLEQNCKEKYYREFVENGISMQMEMVGKNGRRMFKTHVSPEKCAKYLSK